MTSKKLSKSIQPGLGLTAQILQGLLASGHYTRSENDVDSVRIIRTDNGADWGAEGKNRAFARRCTADAIEDAISLANELLDQLKLDELNTL